MTLTQTRPQSTVDIMTEGMDYLAEKLGVVGAEIFISTIQREKFDYTKWHQEKFARDMTCREFLTAASDYAKSIGK